MLNQAQVINRPTLKAIYRQDECNVSMINLTSREIQVLEYICLGYTMKQIALMLYISESTVISHKRKLLHKFNVSNLVRLGVLAERYDMTIA